jgi:putative membrane protein
MRWLFRFIFQIIANAIGLAIAVYLVPQVTFTGDIVDYVIVGAILALANLIIGAILRIITAPLIFLSMGLFTVVINAIILFAVDWFAEDLAITGIRGYFWAVIIISIINGIFHLSSKRKP